MQKNLFAHGVWPVMLTPFTQARAIDWAGVDALTDWYLEAGVAGLFSVCLSSEMYELTADERLDLARRVTRRVAHAVPVVATGTFGGPIAEQALFVRKMADTGVDAVVATACQIAQQADDDACWQANAETLLALTGSIPLGLYECPQPYHRLLTPALTAWASATGRFHFLKDTSCDLAAISAKLGALQTGSLKLFNAHLPTLLASLDAGGDGYCGIAANFVPTLPVWLCANFRAQPALAARLQRFLDIVHSIVHLKYPASAKAYLALSGLKIGSTCRVPQPALAPDDVAVLRALRGESEHIYAQLVAVHSVD